MNEFMFIFPFEFRFWNFKGPNTDRPYLSNCLSLYHKENFGYSVKLDCENCGWSLNLDKIEWVKIK